MRRLAAAAALLLGLAASGRPPAGPAAVVPDGASLELLRANLGALALEASRSAGGPRRMPPAPPGSAIGGGLAPAVLTRNVRLR